MATIELVEASVRSFAFGKTGPPERRSDRRRERTSAMDGGVSGSRHQPAAPYLTRRIRTSAKLRAIVDRAALPYGSDQWIGTGSNCAPRLEASLPKGLVAPHDGPFHARHVGFAYWKRRKHVLPLPRAVEGVAWLHPSTGRHGSATRCVNRPVALCLQFCQHPAIVRAK